MNSTSRIFKGNTRKRTARYKEQSKYYDLLWQKGKQRLEKAVEKTLNLLGIDAEPKEPVDLVYQTEDGALFIEIEGSEGCIQVDKGRQLLGYIANQNDYDPAKVHGALIGNPYRLQHPTNRPPQGSHEGLFSRPLMELSDNQGWPLVTTLEIFQLVNRYQNGDVAAPEELRNKLGLS